MTTIAFQGVPGAYSDLACRRAYPGWATLPCPSFEAAMEAVRDGRAQLAMLPRENSLAGRVPETGDCFTHPNGWVIEVTASDGRRIESLRLHPPAAPAAGAALQP